VSDTTVQSLSVERREALWRRHAEAYDDLLYAFMAGENARRRARERRSPRGWWMRRVWPVWNGVCWWCWHATRWMAWRPVRPGSGGVTVRRGPCGWWLRMLECHLDRRSDGAFPRKRLGCSVGVSYGELAGARHGLSVPRFYSPDRLREEHFRSSDPLDAGFVGCVEADFARARSEIDGEFA
jgi:hypothetical protein